MSGLEAIGVIASVSQLVQYTAALVLNLQDLYRNVERSGERCNLYREQINQLIQITDVIRSLEEVLRSDTITTHVRALVRTTDSINEALSQGCVGDVSRKWKRCLKAWQWNKAEDSILKGFADLERDKSCLTLCILGIYGSLISRIDRNIGDGLPQLHDQVGKIERTLSSCSAIANEGYKTKESPASLNKHAFLHQITPRMHKADGNNQELAIRGVQALQVRPQAQTCDEDPQAPSTDGSSVTLSESAHAVQQPNTGRSASGYSSPPGNTLADESSISTRSWSGNTVSDKAMQINGNVGKKDAIDSALVNCHWSQNEAKDQSKQVNGEILDAEFAAMFFCRTQASA